MPNEIIALNATVEPIFIRERRTTIVKLTERALRGTINLEST